MGSTRFRATNRVRVNQTQGLGFPELVLLLLVFMVVILLLELVLQMAPDEPSNIPFLSADEVCHLPQRV